MGPNWIPVAGIGVDSWCPWRELPGAISDSDSETTAEISAEIDTAFPGHIRVVSNGIVDDTPEPGNEYCMISGRSVPVMSLRPVVTYHHRRNGTTNSTIPIPRLRMASR